MTFSELLSRVMRPAKAAVPVIDPADVELKQNLKTLIEQWERHTQEHLDQPPTGDKVQA